MKPYKGEVDAYFCSNCEEAYLDRKDAVKCCTEVQ